MPTLTPGDGQDLLAAYKRAWERRDPEAPLALCTPTDAEHRANPFDDAVVGANAIRQMWNDVAAEPGERGVRCRACLGRRSRPCWPASTARTRIARPPERVRIRGFMTIEVNDDGLIQRLRQWPVSSVVGTDSTFKVDRRPEGGLQWPVT